MPQPLDTKDTCHICGEKRSRAFLSVEEHKTLMPGTNEKVLERVLYCNDKAECAAAAPKFSFVKQRPPVTATRQRRFPGE